RSVKQRSHGLFEVFSSGHSDCIESLTNVFRSDWATGAATRHIQDIRKHAIAAHVRGDYPVRVGPVAQNRCSSAITKEDAGIPIGPIGDRAQFLRSNNENGVIDVSRDKLL